MGGGSMTGRLNFVECTDSKMMSFRERRPSAQQRGENHVISLSQTPDSEGMFILIG